MIPLVAPGAGDKPATVLPAVALGKPVFCCDVPSVAALVPGGVVGRMVLTAPFASSLLSTAARSAARLFCTRYSKSRGMFSASP